MGLEIGGNRQQDVQLALLCLSVFMYMDRVSACLCYLKYAVYCPWAGTDFMVASICMSQRQVFTFRAAALKI